MTHPIDLLPGVPPVESPLFEQLLPYLGFDQTETEVARSLNTNGYAVIDFPDPMIDQRIKRLRANLVNRFSADLEDPESYKAVPDQRLQDAWRFDQDVHAIATNPHILALLSKLYRRRAIPFQTLNFPVGTQQHLHSDAVHFSSQPERFMCGVWLALEDIHPEAGPLIYCPGSHRWPIINNTMIGSARFGNHSQLAQSPYEPIWQAMIKASQLTTSTFLAKKGQALVWAANLLHGGMHQSDPRLTRWSQVTHYFFDDCLYYTPAFSEEPLGKLELRDITDIGSGAQVPNRLFGREIALPGRKKSLGKRILKTINRAASGLRGAASRSK